MDLSGEGGRVAQGQRRSGGEFVKGKNRSGITDVKGQSCSWSRFVKEAESLRGQSH